MLLRLAVRSVTHRRRTFALVVLSVAVGASLLSTYSTIAWDAGERFGRVLAAYGADLVLVPGNAQGALIPEAEVARLDSAPRVAAYAPLLNAAGEVNGQGVELAGVNASRMGEVDPGWRTVRLEGPGGAVAGVEAAARLGLERGSRVEVRSGGRAREFVVSDVVSTGGPEDRRLFLDLRALQDLSGRGGGVSEVRVRTAPGAPASGSAARAIEGRVAGVRAKSVEQVALAETQVLSKLEMLVGIAAFAVLGLSALGVMSTVAASMFERREEIGLASALGADRRAVLRQFLVESALGGAAGGLVGLGAGVALSQWAVAPLFGVPFSIRPLLAPLVVGAAVAVSVAASLLPAMRGAQTDPCVALRGE